MDRLIGSSENVVLPLAKRMLVRSIFHWPIRCMGVLRAVKKIPEVKKPTANNTRLSVHSLVNLSKLA